MNDARHELIRGLIRDVPDFPKPGILFKDISPLLAHAEGFRTSVELLAEAAAEMDADMIAGPEARGFIFGTPLAQRLELGFAPIRKPGKLPWTTLEETYELEYGTDSLQIHDDAFKPGQRVLLVDDLLATGGTMAACARLVAKTGAQVVGALFVVELSFLDGRRALSDLPTHSLLSY